MLKPWSGSAFLRSSVRYPSGYLRQLVVGACFPSMGGKGGFPLPELKLGVTKSLGVIHNVPGYRAPDSTAIG